MSKPLKFEQVMPAHYAEMRSAVRTKQEKAFKGFIRDEYLVENACWGIEGLMDTFVSILDVNVLVKGVRLPEEPRKIFTYFLGEERAASWIKEVEDHLSSVSGRSLRTLPPGAVMESKIPKPKINTNTRLFDLVRFMRSELHEADLITGEEYAWLAGEAPMNDGEGSPSPRRLEDYDQAIKTISAKQPKLHIRFFNNDEGFGEVIIGPLEGINQDFRGGLRLQFPSKEECDKFFPEAEATRKLSQYPERIEDDVVELWIEVINLYNPEKQRTFTYQRWDIFLKE